MQGYLLKIFESQPGNHRLRCFDLNQGDNAPPLAEHPLPAETLRQFIERTEAQYHSPLAPALHTLGRDLYTWLEDATQGCIGRLRARQPDLALHLDGDAGLRHLPWELLHDGDAFLCQHPNQRFTPVRRAAPFAPRDPGPKNRPLRVLFMASSPQDAQPELDFEREEAHILSAVRGNLMDLVVEESGSLAGLQRVINDYREGRFDVVHLTGHADIDEATAFFWLEDEYGRKQRADAAQLARAFGGRFPRLLFLSGCRSGQTPALGMPSLSEALVQAGAPAVLGWGLPVGDQAATLLAGVLYEKLAVGDPLDAAVAQARQALLEGESPYWHLLRLYSNAAPLTPLVTPPRTPDRKKLKTKEAAADFLDAERRMRVCDRKSFVGRRRLLQQALRTLCALPGEADHRPGLLLHGMGGLGKSSAASRLCDRLSATHRHWVWVDRIDEDALRRVIAEKARNPAVNEALNQPDLDLAQRLTEVLDHHLQQPLLFVFDNFEHNAETRREDAAPDRHLPRTRDDGTLILRPEAEAALRALLRAIDDSQSESRVLITCRQRLANLPLAELGLHTMQGGEWDKKRRGLPAFAEDSRVAEGLRQRALELAAGNPRLLDWLDRVVQDAETDSEALLQRLEQRTDEFREDALLEGLLEQLPSPVLRTLALLALFELPVPEAALTALEAIPDPPARLRRLLALGLAEGLPSDGQPAWWYASPLVTPLVERELSEGERQQALQRAARALHRLWWAGGGGDQRAASAGDSAAGAQRRRPADRRRNHRQDRLARHQQQPLSGGAQLVRRGPETRGGLPPAAYPGKGGAGAGHPPGSTTL